MKKPMLGRVTIGGWLVILACVRCASGTGATDPVREPEVRVNPEPADQPVPRQVEHSWMSVAEWRERHRTELDDPVRARAKVVFLGDSITQGWAASAAYRRQFAAYTPLGLGIGGDQTQHVLWRLGDGALRGVHAQAVVVMIGVNNLGNGHSARETSEGVRAVLARVRRDLPTAAVLLLCILPTGSTKADPMRQKVAEANRLLRSLASEQVTVLDVGDVFLDADGRIPPELMADFLHPTALGYERLSRAVAPELSRLLGP
jgi:lysophospholipase L1-like esterase